MTCFIFWHKWTNWYQVLDIPRIWIRSCDKCGSIQSRRTEPKGNQSTEREG